MKKIQFLLLISIFVLFAFGSLAYSNDLAREEKQTCKAEIEKICPKEQYRSKKAKLDCIETNMFALSDRCKKKAGKETEQELEDYCRNDILRFCEVKKQKDGNFKIVREGRCRRALKKNISMLSYECLNGIRNENDSVIDRKIQRKKQKQNRRLAMKSGTGLSRAVIEYNTGLTDGYKVASYGGSGLAMNIHTRNRNKDINSSSTDGVKKENTKSKKKYNNNFSDRALFEDNGNESGSTIFLQNGRTIRDSQMKRLREKYGDEMDNMNEEALEVFIEKYFPNTQPPESEE